VHRGRESDGARPGECDGNILEEPSSEKENLTPETNSRHDFRRSVIIILSHHLKKFKGRANPKLPAGGEGRLGAQEWKVIANENDGKRKGTRFKRRLLKLENKAILLRLLKSGDCWVKPGY